MRSETIGLLCLDETAINPKRVKIFASINDIMCSIVSELLYINSLNQTVDVDFAFSAHDISIYHVKAQIGDRVLTEEFYKFSENEKMLKATGADSNIFKLRLGKVDVGDSIKITLNYGTKLMNRNLTSNMDDFNSAITTLSLPFVLNPKYTSSSNIKSGETAKTSTSYLMDFEASVKMSVEIVEITSKNDTFTYILSEDKRTATSVRLQSNYIPDHDLELLIKTREPITSLMVTAKSELLSKNCLLLQTAPNVLYQHYKKEIENEIVFLIDRSGSMNGTKIKYTKAALLLMLKSLPLGCRFQIIGFGVKSEALFEKPVLASEKSISQALAYQNRLTGDLGSTDMFMALVTAFHSPLPGATWHRNVIILSDGGIKDKRSILNLVSANARNNTVHIVGLGLDVKKNKLSAIAHSGRGSASFVLNEAELYSTVIRIMKNALQPRCTQISITCDLYDAENKNIDVRFSQKEMDFTMLHEPMTYYGTFVTEDASAISGQFTVEYNLFGEKKSHVIDMKDALFLQNDGGDMSAKIEKISFDLHVFAHFTQCTDEKTDSQLEEQIEGALNKSVVYDPNECDLPEIISPKPVGDHSSYYIVRGDHFSCRDSYGTDDDLKERSIYSAEYLVPEQHIESRSEIKDENLLTNGHFLLADLQNLDGRWNLDFNLASVLKKDFKSLKTSIVRQCGDLQVTDPMWATALVITFLECKYTDLQDEWLLIVEKAELWLFHQVSQLVTEESAKRQASYKDLLHEARQVIKA